MYSSIQYKRTGYYMAVYFSQRSVFRKMCYKINCNVRLIALVFKTCAMIVAISAADRQEKDKSVETISNQMFYKEKAT